MCVTGVTVLCCCCLIVACFMRGEIKKKIKYLRENATCVVASPLRAGSKFQRSFTGTCVPVLMLKRQ